jgi:hypothetical protein
MNYAKNILTTRKNKKNEKLDILEIDEFDDRINTFFSSK